MSLFRGFIAVDIPTTPKIREITKEIAKTQANVKLVEPENIHITLKFLGDTQESLIDEIEHIMTAAVKNIPSFSLHLKHTGVFPNKNYMKVIWIGIEDNGSLATISTQLE